MTVEVQQPLPADHLGLTTMDSKRSILKKSGDLDGSLHVSTHQGRVGGVPTSHTADAVAAEEDDANSFTEGTDDFPLLDTNHKSNNEKNGDDDASGSSFCEADETCSADPRFCRRGMSLGPDELEDFMVEFGDEIVQAAAKGKAYYDEQDGDKIEVPISCVKNKPKGEHGQSSNEAEDLDAELKDEKEQLEGKMAQEEGNKEA